MTGRSRLAQLIFLDPGGTTGYAVAVVAARWLEGLGDGDWTGLKKALVSVAVGQVDGWSIDGRGKVAREGSVNGGRDVVSASEIVELILAWPEAAWGYEDFILRKYSKDRDLLAPVRMFSMIEFGIWSEDGRLPFTQSANLAKSAATDPRMREAGLYRAGLPHGTDAARHVATFLRRARSDAKLREAAWPELFA